MNISKSVEILNDLLAKNYDAENGYKEAADNLKNNRLKFMCVEYADQRRQFGHEIKEEIRALGGEPDKGETIAAKVHQFWIDIKTAFTSENNEAVLEEINRGEQYAIDAYKNALQELPMNSSAYEVARKHKMEIERVYAKTRALEEVYD